MATTLKQALYASIVSVMTTELNSLGSTSWAISGAMGSDATTAAELLGDFELYLASLTPTGTPFVDLYLIRAADGTNYQDPNSAAQPPQSAYVGSFETTTGAGAKRIVLPDIPLPPGLFKAVVKNNTNVSLASSGNTLKFRPHSLQNV